jgi:hypothetical protein
MEVRSCKEECDADDASRLVKPGTFEAARALSNSITILMSFPTSLCFAHASVNPGFRP